MLAEFLLARIAEDEQRIYACDSDGEFRVTWVTLHQRDGSFGYTTVAADHGDGNWCADGTSYAEVLGKDEVDAAEPFFDAHRVLAECEAKRRIVERVSVPDPHTASESCVDCDVLYLLALPYADHPDYEREWAVE